MKKLILLPVLFIPFIASCKSGGQNIHKMNENVETNNWIFNAKRVYTATDLSSLDKGDYMIIRIDITNKNDKKKSIGDSDFKLYKGTDTYSIDSSAELSIEDSIWGGHSIEPNTTYTANLAFKPPVKFSEAKYELQVDGLEKIALYDYDNDKLFDEYMPLGQAITFDTLEVKATEFKFTKYVTHLRSADEGKVWAVISYTLKNITKGTITIADKYYNDFMYDGEYDFDPTYAMFSEFLEYHTHIPTMDSIDLIVAFEVPEEVQTSIDKPITYTFSSRKAGSVYFGTWRLR